MQIVMVGTFLLKSLRNDLQLYHYWEQVQTI